jgi:hypothetical protein
MLLNVLQNCFFQYFLFIIEVFLIDHWKKELKEDNKEPVTVYEAAECLKIEVGLIKELLRHS